MGCRQAGTWFGAVCALLLLAVCGTSGNAAPKAPAVIDDPSASLVVAVKTDKPAYTPGEVIKFSVTIENPTSRDIPLAFGSSQIFDITIETIDKKPKVLWTWSRGRSFTQSVTSITVDKSSKVMFLAQTDNSGPRKLSPLLAGKYTVRCTLTTLGGFSRLKAATTVTIKK